MIQGVTITLVQLHFVLYDSLTEGLAPTRAPMLAVHVKKPAPILRQALSICDDALPATAAEVSRPCQLCTHSVEPARSLLVGTLFFLFFFIFPGLGFWVGYLWGFPVKRWCDDVFPGDTFRCGHGFLPKQRGSAPCAATTTV